MNPSPRSIRALLTSLGLSAGLATVGCDGNDNDHIPCGNGGCFAACGCILPDVADETEAATISFEVSTDTSDRSDAIDALDSEAAMDASAASDATSPSDTPADVLEEGG